MANNVFANGREISCKAASGKSICAFPDVCMTPPENPATPPGVPVPYPNTGFARDTTNGSRTVKISRKEVMLKNKSYFKKSVGDEAGCAAKKGVITSSHRGKVYFIAWSDDVKIEGENAVRHFDMTTHNHASPMANEAAPMVHVDSAASSRQEQACKQLRTQILSKYSKLGKELRKYDPIADAKGGFKMKWGVTKPCGHYKEIRDLQRGLKNDLTRFTKDCAGTGLKIDRNVDRMANQTIVRPPGC